MKSLTHWVPILAGAASLLIAATGAHGQGAEMQRDAATAPTTSTIQLRSADPRRSLLNAARTYTAYHEEVDWAGRREIAAAEDLEATMDGLAAFYGEGVLADAQIAYAALVASQHPEFVDAVRAVADFYGIDVAREGLMTDTVFVTGFAGARDAVRSVGAALNADADELHEVADRYRLAAYNLQNESWARQRMRDRADRLATLESASNRLQVNFPGGDPASLRAQSDLGAGRLGSAAALFGEGVADAPAGPMTAPDLTLLVGDAQLRPDERRIGRILTVAALQAIEQRDDRAIAELLEDPAAQRCIAWARLDLAQCVAAGQFTYEDSFCIAEHALDDIATCLSVMRSE
ncbi:MAG: hypothetical protein AAFX09_00020 [Pseudomonadota bacterium]